MALGETKDLKRFQKTSDDTLVLIEEIREALKVSNLRINDENRCLEIFERLFMIPFNILIKRNSEIEYQGSGKKITKEQADQILSVRGVGRFELIGVSDRKSKSKRATIKYRLAKNLKDMIEEKVKVVENGEENIQENIQEEKF
jgi:hypothetical protein